MPSLLLYFFSGTGNTYRAADWLAEYARQHGAAARLIPIDAAQPASEITGADQLIGLLTPTHAFSAPWAMVSFALRLPRPQKNARPAAFSLLTRGAIPLGRRLILPGLEGSGAYVLALILALKGYRVTGATGLDMPGSWLSLFPGMSRDSAERIMAHAKPRALNFLKAQFIGSRSFQGFIPLIFGILLLPLTFLYLIMGRFFLAKLFYASPTCNGCGLCAKSCPVGAIKMQGAKHPRPYWTFLCESCTRCMNFCPQKSVEASYPFAALLIYLSGIPIAAYLLDLFARYTAQAAGWKGTLVETIIDYPYKLLAIFAAYLLLNLALRIPLFNRLLTLATPTHYYRRYHEPAVHLNDLTK